MFHLFVCEGATYAAKIGGGTISGVDEAPYLDTACLAIFAEDGTLVTTANASTLAATQSKFYLALGSGDTTKGARISVFIPQKIYTRANRAYNAGTLQVDVIGAGATLSGSSANLPNPLVPGTVAGILIIDGNAPVNNIVSKKYRYEYVVKPGDTNASVLNGLIALINADVEALVTASAQGSPTDGIILTAKAKNQKFITSAGSAGYNAGDWNNDILKNATLQTDGGTAAPDSTAIVYTIGTPNDVLAIEQVFSTTEGNTNQIWLSNMYWKVPSYVNASSTYDLLELTFDAPFENSVDLYKGTKQQITFALKVGSAQLTSINTIVNALFTPIGIV